MRTVQLLQQAAEIIRYQRNALELAHAKLDVFEKCAMMAGMRPPQTGWGEVGPDLVQELQKEAESLVSESLAKVDPATRKGA